MSFKRCDKCGCFEFEPNLDLCQVCYSKTIKIVTVFVHVLVWVTCVAIPLFIIN